jgi:DNA-binding transcriptional MerR regulator
MKEREEYLINELAQRAGVTVRTIRYYTQEGLLPEPDTSGKYATYGRGHLLRLELIKQMKDAYLPLREIRQVLAELSDSEVEGRLQEIAQQPLPGKPPQIAESKSSALDYIARVRGRQAELRAPEKDSILPDVPAPKPPSQHPAPPVGRVIVLEDDLPGEAWRRIEIAPGIELNLREPVERALEDVIEQFIKEIQKKRRKSQRGG